MLNEAEKGMGEKLRAGKPRKEEEIEVTDNQVDTFQLIILPFSL